MMRPFAHLRAEWAQLRADWHGLHEDDRAMLKCLGGVMALVVVLLTIVSVDVLLLVTP